MVTQSRLVAAPSAEKNKFSDAEKQQKSNWLAVMVCVLCGVVSALQVVKVSIAAPFLISDLSLGHSTIGGLGGVFSLLGMLGGIPIASIALRLGLKRSVVIGMLILSLCSFAAPLSSLLWMLYGLRVVEGLGFILVTVSAPTLVQAQVQDVHKDVAMSFWSCFMPAGIAIMMFLGPLFSSWQTIWLVNGLTAAVALLLVYCYVPSSYLRSSIITFRRLGLLLRAVLSVPAAVQITLIFSFYNLLYFAFYNFFPLLMVESLQQEHIFAGIVTGFAAIANIIGNLFSGALLSRGMPRRRICMVSFFAMALMGWFIFTLGENPFWIALAALFFAGAGGMLPTAVLSSAPIVSPIAMAIPMTLGLYMQGSNLGQVLGPLITGLSTDAFGWSAVGPMFIVLGILGILVLLFRKLEV